MSYERLEFLGDSVLELTIARTLYERYPDFSEGRLTKIRAQVVARPSCASVARELGLAELLRERGAELGGEAADTLSRNRRILAAVLEAALGAIYLEHGFDKVMGAVAAAFATRIEQALVSPVDHKTMLQEALGKAGRKANYNVVEVEGPPHDRSFVCAVIVDGDEAGRGSGRSKKEAEQAAAFVALETLALEAAAAAPAE